MENQKTPKELHKIAAEYMQNAITQEIYGKKEQAIEQHKLAFQFEKQAAMCLFSKFDKEPTRGILFRSAANLAISCGLFDEAQRMVAAGLAGYPCKNTKEELLEIFQTKI
jgi:hypothetical protein